MTSAVSRSAWRRLPRGCGGRASRSSCVDTSRDAARPTSRSRAASLVAFYLPMHTATRLAGAAHRSRRARESVGQACAYGLYAPLNASWLRERGVDDVLGPEAEADLVASGDSRSPELQVPNPKSTAVPAQPRHSATAVHPARSLGASAARSATRRCRCRTARRASSAAPTRRAAASTSAGTARSCRSIAARSASCRSTSCWRTSGAGGGRRAAHLVRRPGLLQRPDARAPDRRAVRGRSFPGVTYDVTIKIEHLLKHADLLPLLRDTGCLFITSAVESIDDDVLAKLRKGHTRADFVEAVELCRDGGRHAVADVRPVHAVDDARRATSSCSTSSRSWTSSSRSRRFSWRSGCW